MSTRVAHRYSTNRCHWIQSQAFTRWLKDFPLEILKVLLTCFVSLLIKRNGHERLNMRRVWHLHKRGCWAKTNSLLEDFWQTKKFVKKKIVYFWKPWLFFRPTEFKRNALKLRNRVCIILFRNGDKAVVLLRELHMKKTPQASKRWAPVQKWIICEPTQWMLAKFWSLWHTHEQQWHQGSCRE